MQFMYLFSTCIHEIGPAVILLNLYTHTHIYIFIYSLDSETVEWNKYAWIAFALCIH